MRAAVAGIGAAVAVAVLLTGCSGGDAGDGAQEAKGLTAAEVCRGFAKDAPTAAALKAAMGSERFRDDLSEPDRALDLLKDATKAPPADSYRPQPVKYCRLLPAESEKDSLSIEFGRVRRPRAEFGARQGGDLLRLGPAGVLLLGHRKAVLLLRSQGAGPRHRR
ncbi:hypothetical protein SNARM312S_01028 [Streptomyces narbonensis]